MTSVGIVRRIPLESPHMEVVVVTAINQGTFESNKFNSIQGLTYGVNDSNVYNAASATDVKVTYSGSTVTVYNDTIRDGDEITVTLYGNLGN